MLKSLQRLAVSLPLLLLVYSNQAQERPATANNGHSHNDYEQQRPFYTAYEAGMGSVEADVFLRNGRLMVAHEAGHIRPNYTLEELYLKPIAALYAQYGDRVFPDTARRLQLLIDIKEDYTTVLPALISQLNNYPGIFDPTRNRYAVKVVLSGNTPPPAAFAQYPDLIYFDGRPAIPYTAEQVRRLGMISADISSFSAWNGKGTPPMADQQKLKEVIQRAKALGIPFRFWGTKDNANTWTELEKMGVDWIGTDHPALLQDFYTKRASTQYQLSTPYNVYKPTHQSDGAARKPKNIILLIGDGMGLAQIQAALTTNHGSLHLASFRFMGLSRTEAANSDITDSAAGGTAMACGTKTNNRYIGMDSSGKPWPSLVDKLAATGRKTGIISTGDITDATPAVFYAHQVDRSMSNNIAADLLQSPVDVLVGPNRTPFTNNPNQQLLQQLETKGFGYAQSLEAYEQSAAARQLVLLADSVCRPVKSGRGNMLTRSLQETIRRFVPNKKGFFIMAEGAQIDYGGHGNDLPYAISELHDFDRAVGAALAFADRNQETLVIVTADHETGGLSFLDADYRKGLIRGHFSTDDHTNIMVPVFAYGPGAAEFLGVYPNTEIHHRISRLAGK
ncbi:MAG: alkaline phosphatase [Candidatus Pseudobacter hemicellulosilyticus]|uniref:Alkaline phosphatase n=1 Tax=Candidatus Pseudobacter hemicellulosilyticus TaxID=3121375 RepID=A0AAJ5WX20_9BACT|nr:MAG: alkaline phosphatase [Pseudobacter sp.]